MQATEKKCLVDGTYRKIAEELISNQYSVGTKLEPIRLLAKKYKVSYMTAQKAVKALQIQGVLEARPGDGIYVTGNVEPIEGSVSVFLESNGDNPKKYTKKNGNYSIAVVMPFWVSERGEAYIYRMIKGLLSESDPHHWSIELIHNAGDLSSHESNHPDFVDKIESRSPDGIVWLQPILSHRMNLMRLVDRGHQVVVTGRDFPDIPLTCIQMDLDDLAEKTIDCLLKHGSNNIAFITGPVEGMFQDAHSVDIVKAMKVEMHKRGLTFSDELVCQAAFTPYDALIVHSFIENHPEVDGIVCLHETHIIEELEKMDCTGFFNKSINMVNTSGIYYSGRYDLFKHFNMINVAWPLENMGRAVVREFEKSWLEDFESSGIDLSVEILD
ncbi:catabolite control protein A [Limihaloglobus sulfuriphilus]|uniref:Catabolite control protein A n=1 Tax=Limihaloglobus sulfuriphilus TaxID=1851148 RepID=A0A1Q2MEK3_9BACT|nr:GntR family transcriptional regulator [Limihaloglobus sulfuriphilus]AQQ71133.1 catabolite control protein A [Limihaloglobus sulfuriphilus]